MDGVIGEVRMFGGNFAPANWAFCDGSQLAVSQYQSLYSVIGTTYGGDGVNTFQVPDLRGRIAVGSGTGASGVTPRTTGEMGGSETNTLTAANLPPHTHPITVNVKAQASSAAGTSAIPVDMYPAVSDSKIYAPVPNKTMKPYAATITLNTTGNGAPLNNMQPFAVTNYIICTDGIYPDRP